MGYITSAGLNRRTVSYLKIVMKCTHREIGTSTVFKALFLLTFLLTFTAAAKTRDPKDGPLRRAVPARINAVGTARNPQDKTVNDFGAFGDGVHDDTSAIQRSLNYACLGHDLYIPEGKYLVSALSVCNLPWSSAATGINGVRIYGSGPESIIWNIGTTNGALQFTSGLVTTAYNDLYLDNFRIHNATSGQAAFGLQLLNVAAFGILNVVVEGSDSTTDLVSFAGAQQGYFKGGTLSNGTNAFNLQPVNLKIGIINSNMIDISSVEIAACVGANGTALALNGQDDGNFTGNHITSCAVGVHAVNSGDGQYNVMGNHFEPIAPGLSKGQLLVDPGYSSSLLFAGNSIYVYPAEIAIDAAGLGTKVYANSIDGGIFFREAACKNQFMGNRYYGSLNDASIGLLKFANDFL